MSPDMRKANAEGDACCVGMGPSFWNGVILVTVFFELSFGTQGTGGLERIFWTPWRWGDPYPSEKTLRIAFSYQKSAIRRIP